MTRSRLALLAVLATVSLVACSRSSDEEQIREVIELSEKAAEAHDTSDMLELLADDYRDNLGNDKSRLQNFLRGYFLTHPKIELLVRIKDIKIETPENARAHIDVTMVGTHASNAESSFTTESESLQIDFKRVDSKWRVVYVDRNR